MLPPAQCQQDIGEVVNSYYDGGKKLARLVFMAICEARQLTRCESVMLGDKIRTKLLELGYLQIV